MLKQKVNNVTQLLVHAVVSKLISLQLISRKRRRRVRNSKEKLVKVKKAVGANGSPSGRRRRPVSSFLFVIKKALFSLFYFIGISFLILLFLDHKKLHLTSFRKI